MASAIFLGRRPEEDDANRRGHTIAPSLLAGLAALLAGSWLLSFVSVGLIRRHAVRIARLDQPTGRSSHSVPIPRGGGPGAIAAAGAAVIVGMAGLDLSPSAPLQLAVAGLLGVMLVGWYDDARGAGIVVRLVVHTAAGIAMLSLVLDPPALTPIPGLHRWLLGAIWILLVVAAINIVNFMDGIDGLVATQCLLFGLHLAGHAAQSSDHTTLVFGVAVAGASGGFLMWNWPPAKIFMGDGGSGTAGYAIALGGALLMRGTGAPWTTAFLPLAPLFLDAVVTMGLRFLRGERLTEAHRTHLYQQLANCGWGHQRVTLLYAVAAAIGALVTFIAPSLPVAAAYLVMVAGAGLLLHRSVRHAL